GMTKPATKIKILPIGQPSTRFQDQWDRIDECRGQIGSGSAIEMDAVHLQTSIGGNANRLRKLRAGNADASLSRNFGKIQAEPDSGRRNGSAPVYLAQQFQL